MSLPKTIYVTEDDSDEECSFLLATYDREDALDGEEILVGTYQLVETGVLRRATAYKKDK